MTLADIEKTYLICKGRSVTNVVFVSPWSHAQLNNSLKTALAPLVALID